jgi:hypothetical protein
VTAVQFAASAVLTVPLAAVREGGARPDGGTAAWLAVAALVVVGTLLPFTLFAWAQSRTTPEVAGAFLNLEPVVGTAAGAVAFGDPFGQLQLVGGAAVLLGIGLSALPISALPTRGRSAAPRRTARQAERALPAPHVGPVGPVGPARPVAGVPAQPAGGAGVAVPDAVMELGAPWVTSTRRGLASSATGSVTVSTPSV